MKLDKIILLLVGLYFGFQLREMMPHPKPIGLCTQTEVNIRSHYAKMFVFVLDQLRLLPNCLKAVLGVDLAVFTKPCTSETLFFTIPLLYLSVEQNLRAVLKYATLDLLSNEGCIALHEKLHHEF